MTSRSPATTARLARWATPLAATALLLSGCAAGGTQAEATTSTGVSSPAAEAMMTADEVMFLTMMIPHHGQALVMADLALEKAEDPRVRDLAQRIRDAQDPEIEAMSQWLTEEGHPVPTGTDTSGHAGHMGMDGMLTDEQMAQLRAASGHEFDHLFLTGMVQHHQGAVDMSRPIIDSGVTERVVMLATAIDEAQRAEIREMKALIEELSQHDGH